MMKDHCRTRCRWLLFYLLAACNGRVTLAKDETTILKPIPREILSESVDDGWRQWLGIGNLKGAVSHRERATALAIDADDRVWIGTSFGRLLSKRGEQWTECQLPGSIQITGIAFLDKDIWLSTSDGIRKLEPEGEDWKLRNFRTYYEGHPSFVSGGYIPGEDAVRQWGYVDDIFIPASTKHYAPHVISTEHGLFSWGGYYGVWHHYWPHFWGGNSEWLDLRELISSRRPTCMTADAAGNLWIGTDGDGLVRVNAHALQFCERSADNNSKDGREFSTFSPDDIGIKFRRVVDITPSAEGPVWFVFDGPEREKYVARFANEKWETCELPKLERPTYQGSKLVKKEWWEPRPLCVFETGANQVIIGVEKYRHPIGALSLDWNTQQYRDEKSLPYPVRKMLKSKTGDVWALTQFVIYQKPLTATANGELEEKARK